MNHLPRPIADWIALWRDLPRFPRQVLLNRAHAHGSAAALTVTLLVDLIVGHSFTTIAAYTALIVLGPPSLVGFAGAVIHTLWGRGLIWADLVCEFCGDGPDDGDDPEPDDPAGDDGDDLIREITDYLHTHAPTTANV
ncbi:hypothetical protein AB0K88_31275 [Streptomyces werraensis]|uniref:hypothetical protein n=1 Tax=Streptomyces werraensis TaxID=68284 RepID=UPI0034261BF6